MPLLLCLMKYMKASSVRETTFWTEQKFLLFFNLKYAIGPSVPLNCAWFVPGSDRTLEDGSNPNMQFNFLVLCSHNRLKLSKLKLLKCFAPDILSMRLTCLCIVSCAANACFYISFLLDFWGCVGRCVQVSLTSRISLSFTITWYSGNSSWELPARITP